MNVNIFIYAPKAIKERRFQEKLTSKANKINKCNITFNFKSFEENPKLKKIKFEKSDILILHSWTPDNIANIANEYANKIKVFALAIGGSYPTDAHKNNKVGMIYSYVDDLIVKAIEKITKKN